MGSLKTQISPKIRKTQISGEKTKKNKKKSLKARQGHIKHVCKISGSSNSQKRRGHWRLKEFGSLCLNQPVYAISLSEDEDGRRVNCWPGSAVHTSD